MPFIPHTSEEIRKMLAVIGVNTIDDLFDEIPDNLKVKKINGLPKALTEMEVSRLMVERAAKNSNALCFIGAGAYEHHIPAAVWNIAARGEFMTAYTPYQAEASQGTLQLIYEYQTMMASLTGMDVSNASLYDGASGLAEAILMSVRINKKNPSKNILVPSTLNPSYRKTIQTITQHHDIKLIELPFDIQRGCINANKLDNIIKDGATAIIIPQPNFFGCLEEVDDLTNWAHKNNLLVIAIVNPISIALFKEPGAWGEKGADIACGEGQSLGVPLSFGGPYFGFLCCRSAYMRQIPGRIIGRTTDSEGNPGYVLTLQAREQHIRRSKATSNICTNQGLMTAAATIYMSLLGSKGLRRVAENCHANTHKLVEKALTIDGVDLWFNQPYFHEAVLRLSKPAKEIIAQMAQYNIQAGFDLRCIYPEMENALLVCCTETKTAEDIDLYVECLRKVLKEK